MMNRDTELSRFSDYRAGHLLNSGMVLARCLIITQVTELAAMLEVLFQALCDGIACCLDGGWSNVRVRGCI